MSALRVGLLLFVASGVSCGGGADLPTQPGGGGTLAKQIVISPNGGTVIAGQTMIFAAQAKDADGNPVNQTLAWGVNDSTIASVSLGTVTGRKPGTVLLSATNGVITGSATVSVLAAVARIDLTPSPDSVIITQTSQLTATLRDEAGASLSDRPITWTSSSDGIATVSTTGLVTGKALGAATITASAEGKSGTTIVVVRPIPVSTVVIAPLAGALTVGDVVQLVATAKDSTGATIGRPITWTSSDLTVGTVVSTTGVFTAKAAGSTTITASLEGKSATLGVTVVQPVPVAAVAVSPATPKLAAGKTLQLTAVTSDANGQPLAGRPVTWATSNAALATVSATTGLVTATSQGDVTITASSEGKSGSTIVSVVDMTSPRVVGLSITPVPVDVSTTAKVVTFEATVTDAGGAGVQRVNFAMVAPNAAVNTCSATSPEPGGTRFDGRWKCSMTIPVGAPPGDWTFSIVALDEAINTVSLGTAELSAAQLPTRFTVISTNPDKLPPTLVALNFPTDVDVSAGPDTLVVAARLTDAGSGVSRFDFSMIAPNGVSTAGCSAFAPTAPGNPADGVWQCALVLPAGAPPGPWSIKAAAVDASFNTTFILPPDKITVVNTAPDPTPPELVSLTITPQTVDVSYGAQVVTVSARLTDAQSGVAGFTFRATARDSTQVECSATSPDTGGGTTADGTWSCRFTIPAGVARGDWLASVAISDKALNQRQYDTAAIGAKGLPTKFTVVSTTAP